MVAIRYVLLKGNDMKCHKCSSKNLRKNIVCGDCGEVVFHDEPLGDIAVTEISHQGEVLVMRASTKGNDISVITRQMIVDAFNEWRDEYKANPEGWTDAIGSGDDYGVKCADKLIECMKRVLFVTVCD